MYGKDEMLRLLEQANLGVNKEYDAIGIHDYTLLECVKNG